MGDSFVSNEVLYENDEIIVCNVENGDEWYEGDLTVMINKKSGEVSSFQLRFYLAKNI